MLEKQIEAAVCAYAKRNGMLSFKFTSTSHAGVCDRMFISSTGKVWFVEFKQAGKKPTPLQSRHHQELALSNVAVYVVDSIGLGREIIDYELQSPGQRHHPSAVRYAGGDATAT